MIFLPRTLGTRPRLACEVRAEGTATVKGFRTRDTRHAADGQPSFCASGIGSAATDDGAVMTTGTG